MPKAAKLGYYAVRIGRVPGIYHSWDDCEAQVKGFPAAQYKKFNTEVEANDFVTAKQTTVRMPAVATPSVTFPDSKLHLGRLTDSDENDSVVVYCDGACKGNGQPGSIAGIGVWWGHGDPRNISERCPGDQTNNRAELIAIVRVLETAPQLKRRLLIKTDSNYSIQCVTTWIFNWMRNGFLAADGKPVKNRVLIKYLAALLHARRRASQTVEFKHVRGHVGIEGNEAADQLATFGATKPAIPERDWEKLEKDVLQGLKPVEPIQIVDDDLKAYADGLLDDDELAGVSDTSFSNVTAQSRTSILPVQVSPARVNAIPILRKNKSPSKGPSGSTMAALQSTPSSTTSTNKEQLEVFASCLLDDDALSALGKDGVFDSDF